MTIVHNVETWRRIFGYSPKGVFVIVDSQVGESRGQLRALPLLLELGLTRFTFTSSWHRFDLVPFEYVVVHEGNTGKDLEDIFPICQFISQNVERASPGDVAKKLLMAHRAARSDSLLVFVLDSEQFMLRDSVGTKSFIDEYVLRRTIGYESLFAQYYEHIGRPLAVLSTGLTLNLALHKLAWELEDEALLRRLGDLFNFRHLPPTSWAWDLLERLAIILAVREDESEISHLLRSWIDHDITRIGRRLFDKLQEFNFELAKVQAERQRLLERKRGDR